MDQYGHLLHQPLDFILVGLTPSGVRHRHKEARLSVSNQLPIGKHIRSHYGKFVAHCLQNGGPGGMVPRREENVGGAILCLHCRSRYRGVQYLETGQATKLRSYLRRHFGPDH